jgi:hypothetical protein
MMKRLIPLVILGLAMWAVGIYAAYTVLAWAFGALCELP